MTTSVIGGAEIQILANASGLKQQLEQQLRPAGATLKRQLTEAVSDASQSFDRLGEAAKEALDDVDYDGVFDELNDDIKDAADGIERELGQAGDKAARDVADAFDGTGARIADQLDIDDEFARMTMGISMEAREAAFDIEREFDGAADGVEDDLKRIGNIDFGSELKAEAGRAADQVVNEFDGLGNRIGDEISPAQIAAALDSIVDDSRRIADKVVDQFDGAGEQIGSELSSGIESSLGKLPGIVAALGIGAGITAAVLGGIDREKITDTFAGSLNLSDEEAAEFGATAGRLYADAYGESFEDIAETLRTAVAIEIPEDQLETIVAQADSMGSAFEGAASEYLTLADQLVNQGVTDTVTEGLDLITASFQQLPTEMQAPLTDAVKEYGTFLDSLGFSTEESFGILTDAAGRGEFALDKTGDALKEFGIRATDLSTGSVAAFEAIGLNAEDMANQVLAGGDTARGAFDEIIGGLLDIEDPAQQANAAIALFGTPLEDLGVDQIPQFLAGLQDMEGGMGDVEGAAARLDEQINNNLSTNLTSFRRTIGEAFIGLGDAVLAPVLNEINPLLQDFVGFLQEKGPAASAAFSAAIEPVFDRIGDLLRNIDFSEIFDRIGSSLESINLGEIFGDFDGESFVDTLFTLGEAAFELVPALLQVGGAVGGAGFSTFTTLAPVLAELAVQILPPLADILGSVGGALGFVAENVPGEVILASVVAFKALNAAMKVNAALTAAGGLSNYLKNSKLVAGATKAWAGAQKLLNLSFLASPVGIAVAAVAALAAGLVIAYRESETFRNAVDAVFDALEPLIDIAKQVGEAFGQFFSGDFEAGFDTLKDAAGNLKDFLGDLGGQAAAALGDAITAGLSSAAGFIAEQISSLFSAAGGIDFSDVFAGLGVAALEAFRFIITEARNLGSALLEAIQEGLDSVGLGFLADIVGGIQIVFEEALGSVIAFISAFLSGEGDITSSGLPGFFERLGNIVRDVFDFVVDLIGVFKDLASGDFSGAFEGFLDAARDLPDLIFSIARSIAEGFVDIIVDILDAVGLDFLIGPFEAYAAGVLAVFDGLAAAIGFAWDLAIDVIEVAVDVIGGIIDGAQAVWDTGVLQTIFDGLAATVEFVWDSIEGTIEDSIAAIGFIIDTGEAIFDGLEAAWDASFGRAGDVVDGFVSGIQSVLGFFGVGGGDDEISDDMGSVFDPLEGLWDTALGLATAPIEAVVDTINGILANFGIKIGMPSLENLFDNLGSLWDLALELALAPINTTIDVINGIFDTFGIDIGLPSVEEAFDSLEGLWDSAWGGATDVVSGVGDTINEFLGDNFGVKIGMPSVENLFDNLGSIWETSTGAATDVVSDTVDKLNDFLGDNFGVNIGMPSVENLFDNLGLIWDNSLGPVVDTVVDFGEDIGGVLAGMLDDVIEFGEDLLEDVTEALEAVGEFFDEAFTGYQEFIGEILEDILDTEIAQWLTGAYDDILDGWNRIGTFLSGKLEDIKSFIGTKLAEARDSASRRFAELRERVTARVTEVRDQVVGRFNDLLAGGRRIFNDVRDTLGRLAGQARDRVVARFGELVTSATNKARGVYDGVKEWLGKLKDFMSGLFDGLSLGSIDISGLTSKLDTVIDKINGAIRAFNSIPGVPDIPTVPTGGGGSTGSGRSFTPRTSTSNFMAEGGLATVPSIVAEDFKPEIVLPLTKQDRMQQILAGYASEIIAAAGGIDAVISALLGEDAFASIGAPSFQVERGDIVPPQGTSRRPPTPPPSAAGRGPAGGYFDQSSTTTHNHFYGVEAGTVAKQMRDRDKNVVQALRIRP